MKKLYLAVLSCLLASVSLEASMTDAEKKELEELRTYRREISPLRKELEQAVGTLKNETESLKIKNEELKAFKDSSVKFSQVIDVKSGEPVEEFKQEEISKSKVKISPYVEGAIFKELDKITDKLEKYWQIKSEKITLQQGTIKFQKEAIKESNKTLYQSVLSFAKKEEDIDFIIFFINEMDEFPNNCLILKSYYNNSESYKINLIESDNKNYTLILNRGDRVSYIADYYTLKIFPKEQLSSENIFEKAKKERHKIFLEDYKRALEYYSSL